MCNASPAMSHSPHLFVSFYILQYSLRHPFRTNLFLLAASLFFAVVTRARMLQNRIALRNKTEIAITRPLNSVYSCGRLYRTTLKCPYEWHHFTVGNKNPQY